MNRNTQPANQDRNRYADFQPQQPLNIPGYGTPSFTTTTTQRVISPFGNFDNLPQYQQHQDAFVQQHLQNQAQYNSGQRAGQNPGRVPVMDAWKQAGDNIASGQYQGNPLATGNMAGLANLFSQYGMTMQPGFQDQLLQMLAPQSAPPALTSLTPKPVNPQTGLPYGQPAPGQAPPPAALPERAPWTPPPPPAGGYRSEQERRDAEYQSRIQYMMNPGLNQDASVVAPQAPPRPTGNAPQLDLSQDPGYRQWRRGIYTDMRARTDEEHAAREQRIMQQYLNEMGGNRQPSFPGMGMPQALYPPGYGGAANGRGVFQVWEDSDGDGVDDKYQAGPGMPKFIYDPISRTLVDPQRPSPQPFPGMGMPQQPAPGYGGAIGLKPADRLFQDTVDRDGDGIDDRFQPGPGQRPPEWPSSIPDPRPRPGAAQPIPPRSQGTPYNEPEPPPPLRAAPGSSGPGWRESEGRRIYDGYTDPRGTGAVGGLGPNHIAPGRRISPITGQVEYDPFTDPIATGGGPATPRNAPIGNTWGTGRPVPPPLRRDPILDPRPSARPLPAPPRNRRGDLYGF